MRILMFGWEFPPHNSGGLGTACFGLTRALASNNIDVLFVLPKKVGVDSSFIKILFADNEKVLFKEIETILKPYVTSDGYVRERDRLTSNVYGKTLMQEVRRYALRARGIAKKEQFDIIHAHDWLSFLAGIEAKKVSSKPLILHVHATEFDRTGNQGVNRDIYEIEKSSLEQADGIIAVSQFTKNRLVEKYGISERKIRVVHNGIDECDYIITPKQVFGFKKNGQKIVLFVGRITIQKGPEYFIRTAKRVLVLEPNVLFVVVGSGDMERQMILEAARLGISSNIIFTGFLRGDALNSIYKSADLFIMPSVSEPFGITPLEAIILGAPVLISRQSGVSEVLTHALKTDFWDIDDMTNKILSVIAHNSLKDTLLKSSKHELRQINWNVASEKCISYYREFLHLSNTNIYLN